MNGLIHIYCGDGKGKTTAAIGLSIRASAGGYQVIFAQFIKSWDTGEIEVLKKLSNITVHRGDFPNKFSKYYTEEERAAVYLENNRLFQQAIADINPSGQTLLVLDEIIGTMDKELIDHHMVYNFLKDKPAHIEVVLTGRNPSENFLEIADYVSEIRKIKHPYEKGINARKGIEY